MSASPLFTPEARAEIVARLGLGVPFTDAATAAGVKPATAKSWLAKGRREPTGPHSEFAQAVERAREAARDRDPMDEGELAQVVSEMARAGSVQAAKLRWEMLRADEPDRQQPDTDSIDPFDKLADARMRKVRGE